MKYQAADRSPKKHICSVFCFCLYQDVNPDSPDSKVIFNNGPEQSDRCACAQIPPHTFTGAWYTNQRSKAILQLSDSLGQVVLMSSKIESNGLLRAPSKKPKI